MCLALKVLQGFLVGLLSFCFSFLSFVYVALPGLEIMETRLASNSERPECLCFRRAGTKGVCHHAQQQVVLLSNQCISLYSRLTNILYTDLPSSIFAQDSLQPTYFILAADVKFLYLFIKYIVQVNSMYNCLAHILTMSMAS